MNYFIDGYNLLFRLPQEKKSLEEARKAIIASLREVEVSLTIVFDGAEGDLPERGHQGSLEIVYTSKGLTADAYILQEISWVKDPQNYTVITSDKQLASHCKRIGAHSQTIRSFLSSLQKKQAPKVKEKPMRDSNRQIERLLKIFNELSGI